MFRRFTLTIVGAALLPACSQTLPPVEATTTTASPIRHGTVSAADPRAEEAGMDGYLTKPIRREDLLRALAGAAPLPPLPDPLPWTSVTVASPDASVDLPRG